MKNIIYTIFLSFIICSCSTNNETDKELNRSSFSGGTLKINEVERFQTLYPPATRDIVSAHIINQIHWGLVRYDVRNLSVLPAIANKWELDSTNTVYTFHLNTNAKFHDDECFEKGIGRNITANDFKYTFELLAKQDVNNKNFFGTIDKILGAKDFYQNNSTEIEGISVLNDSTLQIKIEKVYDLFIYYLANPACVVLAKEAIEKYGANTLVGSGPFKIATSNDKENLYLSRNKKFFMKDENGFSLPYLDSVKISFVGSTKSEIRMFEDDKLDLVLGINNEHINDFLDENIDKFQSNPPLYILKRSEKLSNISQYNILKANVNNFYTNKMDNLDLSIVYFAKPQINEQRNK